jgi:hypothetical protein
MITNKIAVSKKMKTFFGQEYKMSQTGKNTAVKRRGSPPKRKNKKKHLFKNEFSLSPY